jgi:hypothetical protein
LKKRKKKEKEKETRAAKSKRFENELTFVSFLTFAIQCFRYILSKPPTPLLAADVWFQIGFVLELQKEVSKREEHTERDRVSFC